MTTHHQPPLDLDHTAITCLEFFRSDTGDHAHALVMYQDTRTPRLYPTSIFQVTWNTRPNGQVCTTMRIHTIHADAGASYCPEDTTDAGMPIILYHVGQGTPPEHASQVPNRLRTSHQAMLNIHTTPTYTNLLTDLSIAIRCIIQHPCTLTDLDMPPMFWNSGHVYANATDAIRADHRARVRSIPLIHLPDIALPMDTDTHALLIRGISNESLMTDNEYRQIHILQHYGVIPIQDSIIPISFATPTHRTHHEQMEHTRTIIDTLQRVRHHFYPEHIDPLMP